jgi:serine/threonine-protein kinase
VHEAETINEQLLSAMTNPAPSIGTLAPGLSIPVIEVIDRALAFDKADRWPDARTMQAAVRSAYQAMTGRNAEEARLSFLEDESIGADLPAAETLFARSAPSEWPKRKASRRAGAVGLFGILAMAAVFAVGYFGLRKTPPDERASLLDLDRADAVPDADAAPDVAAQAAAEAFGDEGNDAGPEPFGPRPLAQAPASASQARPATTKPKKGPAKKPVVRKHRRK